MSNDASSNQGNSQKPQRSSWGGAIGAFFLVTIIMKACTGNSSKTLPPTAPVTPPGQYQPIQSNFEVDTVGRLKISWKDSTWEIQEMLSKMTPQEAFAIGLSVALTGQDTYAARVRILNTGNIPVRVYPENILVHFNGESAPVITINNPRFLRRGILQPGNSVSGLVIFSARIDIGAIIRLGGGSLSYNDESLQIIYDQ